MIDLSYSFYNLFTLLFEVPYYIRSDYRGLTGL